MESNKLVKFQRLAIKKCNIHKERNPYKGKAIKESNKLPSKIEEVLIRGEDINRGEI